jgi:predicted metal-dependent HD superfamily phosphohydrolase
VDDRGLPLPLAADLLHRYAEPHRRYHDVVHLDTVLGHIDALDELASDPAAVRLAAWFHDAIYDPERTDNEAASAALAELLLPANNISADQTAEVARLVRLTATHEPGDGDLNGAVLCDADLAVLGSEPASYLRYTQQIRAEYQQYDDLTFALGRSQVLTALLQQPQLFRTSIGVACWEAPARCNITAELADLAKVAASAGATRPQSSESPTPGT